MTSRQRTIEHLESYFSRSAGELYLGHQPIYGFSGPARTGYKLVFMARVFSILTALNQLQFNSFLDVGGGEGFIAFAVREIFGSQVVSCDLSLEANKRCRELFGVPSVVTEAYRLPFADHTFDVVLCSEVIEHLERPVPALRELLRVASKAVVVTTMETARNEFERTIKLWLREPEVPHGELCHWTLADFNAILGREDLRWSYLLDPRPYATLAYRDEMEEDRARATVQRMVGLAEERSPTSVGLRITKLLHPESLRDAPRLEVDQLLGKFFQARVTPGRFVDDCVPLPPVLCCPELRTPLQAEGRDLLRAANGVAYPVFNGVPDFRSEPPTGQSARDEIEARYRKLFSLKRTVLNPILRRGLQYVQDFTGRVRRRLANLTHPLD